MEPGRPRVIVGTEFSDDAAVVRLDGDERRALVLTTDVIAPIVDGPEDFGAIAAANALSDVYAMGGKPLYALNLVFFPIDRLPVRVLARIMEGARAACARAGVLIVGGHTVTNGDLKFGLAVTGEVEIGRELSNRGAHADDVLVLSKAIGTGLLGSAIKAGELDPISLDAVTASMLRLNGEALAIARAHEVSACTDVTGFSLLGHLSNILDGSALTATVDLDALPVLPGARALAESGQLPGGSKANFRQLAPRLRMNDTPTPASYDDARVRLATDAQTSGGLLCCIPRALAQAACKALLDTGHAAAIIGSLAAPGPNAPAGSIRLRG